MRRLPQNISLLAVSIFTVGAVAVIPVSAQNGSDDTSVSTTSTTTTTTKESSGSGGSGSTSTSGTSGKSTVKTGSTSSAETENEAEATSETSEVKDLRSQAQKLLADQRHDKKETKLEDRQQACEAHKTELTKRSENYSRNAAKHLDVFNGIYAKVLDFQSSKNLTADNFASLKMTADAKKAAATTAVAALSDPSTTTVDCTSTDPAANVATLKTAVGNARAALQDYRTAIKNVIVALQTAKTANATSTHTEVNNGTEAN